MTWFVCTRRLENLNCANEKDRNISDGRNHRSVRFNVSTKADASGMGCPNKVVDYRVGDIFVFLGPYKGACSIHQNTR
jgi:hypothetical protein